MSRERPLSFLGYQFLDDWRTMPWDPKAEEVFAGGLSDGSVPHAKARQVAAAIEAHARNRGHLLASIGDVGEAIARLATDFTYQPATTVAPEYTAAVAAMPDPTRAIAAGRNRIRQRRADLQGDTSYAAIFAEVRRSVDTHDDAAHTITQHRAMTWCGHVPHVMAIMMAREEFGTAEQIAFVDAVEQVARDRGRTGVTPRDFETALLRAGATGVANGE